MASSEVKNALKQNATWSPNCTLFRDSPFAVCFSSPFLSPLRSGLLEVSAAMKAVQTFILSSFSFLQSPKRAETHLPWGSLVPSIMKPQCF